MKYIKLFESFKDDINDILLEVNDLGYTTGCFSIKSTNHSYIFIEKRRDENGSRPYINFDEIKDCALRLKDYLGDRYFSCDVYKTPTNNYYAIDLNENTKLGDNIVQFNIIYR